MRRIAMVVVCLSAIASGQSIYSGAGSWSGGGTWGPGLQHGGPGGDLPLPDFTAQGGVGLSLPQKWVDAMEPFSQTIENTVYVGNAMTGGCPTAPARTNYKSQAKNAGDCDFGDTDGSGLETVLSDWAGLAGANYDQRWDVVVTHGTTYTLSCTNGQCWIWPSKYNGAIPTKYIVYHSDCTPAQPCSGTNDLGYNPAGRQVCSHGMNDMLGPDANGAYLPSMGQRNHGCAGYLGTIPSTANIPSTLAMYRHDSNYNDLGNMFTITATAQASPISMGAASTQGGPQTCNNANPTQPGTDACPVEGVNHIWMTDVHITSNTSNSNQFTAVNFSAAEWSNVSDATSGYAGATANHVGLSQFYLDGNTDDDGFGLPHMINGVKLGCSYCAITHGYIDGIKADGGESHAVTLNEGIGPILLSDVWIEGGAIGLWGGGGGNPSIRGQVPADVEARRLYITYDKRWLPPPAGIQPISKKVQATGDSCIANVLVLAISNSPGGGAVHSNITGTAVYVTGIKDANNATVAANGWYTTDTGYPSTTQVVISPSNNSSFTCSGTPVKGTVYGFGDVYDPSLGSERAVVASASALQTLGTVKTGDIANAGEKNRIESKSWERVLLDGVVLENAGVDGQSGQLMGSFLRAYSNVAYDNGNETARINDLTVTNFIGRNATYGLQISSRSGGGSYVAHTIASISCTGTTEAVVTPNDTMTTAMYNAPNFLANLEKNCSDSGNLPCTRASIGADVYISGTGGLIPDGWYTTGYPGHGGDYGQAGSSVTVLADYQGLGNVCTVSGGTGSTGTIYAVSQGAGHGVSWPEHRFVYQNGLEYAIGDYGLSNGSSSQQYMSTGGSGNNFTVQVTVNGDNSTATAVIQAIKDCPGGKQCPRVAQAVVGDLAYIRCLDDERFSSGPQGSKGAVILSIAPDQLSFTYTPQNGSPALQAGNSTACPLETPLSTQDTGYYNHQSFPWPFYLNHITALGVNGFYVAGDTSTFARYGTFANSFQLIPGPSDVAPNNSCTNCRHGFYGNNGETYQADDSKGITNINDRNSFTFKSYAMSNENINYYPMFPCGTPPSSGCLTGGNPATYPGTNSTPTNVASSGSSVTCGGVACDATHYIPDSIGFIGSMNATTFPFALADWRQYALHSSSPYKAGGILDATDGLDNGAQIPLIINATARTLYSCPLACGSGPHRDGPEYGALYWSTYTGAVNYRVYRDGTTLAGTTTNPWFNDYGLPAGSHTWTVKAWDGSVEHDVTGLASQMY